MNREVLDTVDAVLSRMEEGETELIALAAGETSLHFLQRVYRSVRQPMSRRLRAAIEALPFEQPKLSAVAMGYMTADDFASRLERAILRSGKSVKQIEATCEEVAPAPAAGATLGQSLAIMQGISRASAGASPIKRRSIP